MMRIGIDCRLPYYQIGGISQYTINLLTALAQIDHENHYIVFHSRKDASSYIPEYGKHFEHRRLITPCHHRLERWTLSIELLAHRLDIMHSPDFIPPAFGARKKVITVHDLNFVYYPEFLTAESRRYYLGQLEWAVRECDHILADSNHTRNDLINILKVPESKITTVYLAANPSYRLKRSKEEIARTLDQFELQPGFILFVGTLSPRKNVTMLLSAYEELVRDRGIESQLLLVGGRGWLSDHIFEHIDRLNLGNQIRYLEKISNDELACLYAAARVFALPSHYEGFGLPVLEAMHCGCPVISSNRGSLPEVVGEAGLLIEPEALDLWVDSLEQVLTNEPLRDSLREKGYLQAGHFTWEQTALDTLAVYEEIPR